MSTHIQETQGWDVKHSQQIWPADLIKTRNPKYSSQVDKHTTTQTPA